MSRFIQPRDLVIAILAAALALALAALWFHKPQKKPAPHLKPDLGGLEQSLEKAAKTALPALPLSNEQITVKAGNETVDARAKEIADLANKLGGDGIVSQSNGKTGVLAQIPGEHAAEFYQKLTGHDLASPPNESTPKDEQWFDITVEK